MYPLPLSAVRQVHLAADVDAAEPHGGLSNEPDASSWQAAGPRRQRPVPHAATFAGAAALRGQQGSGHGRAHNAGIIDEFLDRRCNGLSALKRTVTAIHQCGARTVDALACFEELDRAARRSGDARASPNRFIYNALISAHVKAMDPDGAVQWFEKMLKKGIRPDVVTYSTLISAHERLADPKRAADWFEHMVNNGVEPNAVTYNALISAYAKAADPEGASDRVDQMVSDGIEPDIFTYGALILAHARRADTQGAVRCFEHMLAQGIQPNARIYSTLISALEKGGDRRQVSRHLRDAVACGAFQHCLGYDKDSNKLDLHSRAVESGAEHERKGVCTEVARAIFRHLLNEQVINRQTTVVVGSHGEDLIKEAIRQCMVDAGWTPHHPIDHRTGRPNVGCWVGSDPGPRGTAKSATSRKPQASPLRAFNKVMGSGTAFIG
ncbi:hypothetical protein ACFJIX_06530 [Roseateles sp. UC29_93]|uniref:hypothetical protein n=1 Tax=Roseateles sp. UC29_93 TaxID=3350177 RepID=UPI003671B26F